MTAFDDLTTELATDLNKLDQAASVLFFAAVASVFLPSYRAWAEVSESQGGLLLEEALEAGRHYAFFGSVVENGNVILSQLEANTPDASESAEDAALITIAQDCWICADIALRIPLEGYLPGDGAWYVLEPVFQAVSRRLFGVDDVGSEDAELLEPGVVSDLRLRQAVAACREAVSTLKASRHLTDRDAARIARILLPLRSAVQPE